MNPTPQSQFQQAAQEAAKELASDSAHIPLIDSIILRHFAPLEAQLVEANKWQLAALNTRLCRANVDVSTPEKYTTAQADSATTLLQERDEARREVELVLGSPSLRVSAEIAKARQAEINQLSADNQRLREALKLTLKNLNRIAAGDLPTTAEAEANNLLVTKALSTPPPSAVQDLELQARKAKAYQWAIDWPDNFQREYPLTTSSGEI